MQQPPYDPNSNQQPNPFWGNMQPPPNWQGQQATNQPFNPQYPSGQYPPQQQQPYQQYQMPPQPMMQTAPQPPKKKPWYKKTWGIVVIIFLALAACGGINNIFSHSATATTSTTATTDTPKPTNTPPPSVHYPPTTEADLHGLAAQGSSDAIHEFHSESVGLTGVCPQPKREVTVDANVTGKQLAEDLLAYFYAQQLTSPCGSVVFAYHTQAEANDPNIQGYTAGFINFTATNANGENNSDPNATNLKYSLKLDVGGFDANKESVVTY